MNDDEIDDPETVMVLRQSEWNDLRGIAMIYIAASAGNHLTVRREQRRALCERIIAATD